MRMIQCDGCGQVDTTNPKESDSKYRTYTINHIDYDMCPKCKRTIGVVMTTTLHKIIDDIRSEHGLPSINQST